MVTAAAEPTTVMAPATGVMTTAVVMSAEVMILVLGRILRPEPRIPRSGTTPPGSPADSREDDHPHR